MRSRTYIATPPGATIREQLKYRGMSQKEFAARMGMSEKHISKLINGDVQLTTETAVRLEIVLGVLAEFWNRLEAIYREKIVLAEAENRMDSDLEAVKRFPYQEMAKLGWVPKAASGTEKVNNLRKFFGVTELSALDNEYVTRIACRRLRMGEKSDLALIAWARRAKILAEGINTGTFSSKALMSELPALHQTAAPSHDAFLSKISEILAGCGIALVFPPPLKGALVRGASFLDGKRAVIAIAAGKTTYDRFQFDLFHELGHVVLGHLEQMGGISEEAENAADEWAENMLASAAKQDGRIELREVLVIPATLMVETAGNL